MSSLSLQSDRTDAAWLRERNRRLGVRPPHNAAPCVYRGRRYTSLAEAAGATGAKVWDVKVEAERVRTERRLA